MPTKPSQNKTQDKLEDKTVASRAEKAISTLESKSMAGCAQHRMSHAIKLELSSKNIVKRFHLIYCNHARTYAKEADYNLIMFAKMITELEKILVLMQSSLFKTHNDSLTLNDRKNRINTLDNLNLGLSLQGSKIHDTIRYVILHMATFSVKLMYSPLNVNEYLKPLEADADCKEDTMYTVVRDIVLYGVLKYHLATKQDDIKSSLIPEETIIRYATIVPWYQKKMVAMSEYFEEEKDTFWALFGLHSHIMDAITT